MVEVELQPDRLSGYITRFGDRESDEGTPLTFFFATSRLAGQRLAFTTGKSTVCGSLLMERSCGEPPGPADQQGYYLLQGQLVHA